MRKNSRVAEENWIKVLNQVKEKITKNNHKYLQPLIKEKKISHLWYPFLKENHIVYLEEGFIKWDQNVLITHKLIEKFRKFVNDYNYNKHPIKQKKHQTKLKFDFSTVEIPKKRKTWESKATTEKWLKNLFIIKDSLDNIECYKLIDLKSPLPNWKTWQSFLVRNNIIHKKNTGQYTWNDKIPITFKIIEAYRKEQHIKNYRREIISTQQLKIQPELQFNLKVKETPSEIKSEAKTQTTKVKVQEPVNIHIQQNEYGVIRKFLKLIWRFLKWLW
jgi:hypothetical protein